MSEEVKVCGKHFNKMQCVQIKGDSFFKLSSTNDCSICQLNEELTKERQKVKELESWVDEFKALNKENLERGNEFEDQLDKERQQREILEEACKKIKQKDSMTFLKRDPKTRHVNEDEEIHYGLMARVAVEALARVEEIRNG